MFDRYSFGKIRGSSRARRFLYELQTWVENQKGWSQHSKRFQMVQWWIIKRGSSIWEKERPMVVHLLGKSSNIPSWANRPFCRWNHQDTACSSTFLKTQYHRLFWNWLLKTVISQNTGRKKKIKGYKRVPFKNRIAWNCLYSTCPTSAAAKTHVGLHHEHGTLLRTETSRTLGSRDDSLEPFRWLHGCFLDGDLPPQKAHTKNWKHTSHN